jgi:hypothetical protein
MTLSTIDLLASIVTAFLSAYPASLDRLGIYYPGAGLRISLQANSETFPDSSIYALPGTVDAPFSEIVVDGGPSREVVRKHAPLTATA